MNFDCDVVIVGTGAAGLYCALNLPSRLRIQMITKESADASDSYLAQGGICVLRGEEDYADFFEDTMKAGHYENDKQAVDQMIRFSGGVIRDLFRLGVRFETEADGSPAYTKEGAHSRPRILYHKDITGQEITKTLLEQVRALPNVQIREHVTMLDLIAQDNACGGIVVSEECGQVGLIRAPIVVLCCGGLGGLYTHTTNYGHITGDALAIAMKHNVQVKNLDYIQIHPTTLYTTQPGRRFLISESVRGEGALLYGKDLQRFTDELQPRDKLTREIWKQMELDGTPHVWEDMRPIGKEVILSHFPNIYQHCLDMGINVLEELIPVVPAQHYFMGGIQVNLASQASMKGLYACGETSCNGVHGVNRLASNSLLESLVFAQRAAEDITFGHSHVGGCKVDFLDLSIYQNQEVLFADYKQTVLDAIERKQSEHE